MADDITITAMPAALNAAVGAIFVPVRDIESARDWYVRLLGYPRIPEILFGHLAVFVLNETSSNLVLDSRIHRPNEQRSTPLFHLNANNAEQARDHVLATGAIQTTEIQPGHWFTFRDPDGNVLMVRQDD